MVSSSSFSEVAAKPRIWTQNIFENIGFITVGKRMNMKLWVAFIDLEGPPGEEHITSTDCGVLLELIDNYLFIEDLTMCKAQWGLQD